MVHRLENTTAKEDDEMMDCSSAVAAPWFLKLYWLIAIIGAMLIMCVMVKTHKDSYHMRDPFLIRWPRVCCFWFLALALLYSAYSAMSKESMFALVSIAILQLAINAAALRFRSEPPNNDAGVEPGIPSIIVGNVALLPHRRDKSAVK